jgi:hypothetical protein
VRAGVGRWGLWVALGVGLVAVVLVASSPTSSGRSLDPASTAPNGTKALVELLRAAGGDVRVSSTAPTARDGVVVLLSDTTSVAMTDDLLAWVGAGGTLVTADPRSSFTPGGEGLATPFGLGDATLGRGGCTIAALDAVEVIAPGRDHVRYPVPDGAARCFDDGKGAFVVDEPTGGGHLVAVGGAGVFTNEYLGKQDNAVLAVALMAPRSGTRVTVLWGMKATESRTSLGNLIPTGVRLAFWELLVAFVVYALWRGRRLGRPVAEVQPVQIAGSELVAAVGNLLQQSKDPDRAARLLRADLRRRLAERLGLGPGADADVLADITAARTGVDRHRLARALTDLPVHSERELLDLTHDLDTITTEVLHGTHP